MGISIEADAETAREKNRINSDNREEGEIVEDEFEDIISSDEEVSMRKRIEELEARNLELEKIANISGIYSCDFSKKDLGFSSERYKNGLIALDLSDAEDYTPKNYISKRVKSTSSSKAATAIRHNRYKLLNSSIYKQTRKHSRQSPEYIGRSFRDHGKTRKRKHEKLSKNRINRKTDRSKKKSRLDYYTTSSEEEPCSLDRDELRVALRHDVRMTNPQGNLRNLIKDATRTLEEAKCNETIEIKDTSDKGTASDDSVSLEEQELRLIALKSAIIKKHLARKKRKEIDEKRPYSPTDFLAPIGNVASYKSSSKQLMENDACNSMDISPIPSPDILYEDRIVKPIDMDLVDSSNSSSPIFVAQQNWTPIDEIPLPIERKYETENPKISPKFPKIISPLPIRLQTMPSKQPIFVINSDEDDDSTVVIQSNEASSPEPIDEEANALRALLLAQKNSPKFNKDKNIKKAEPTNMIAVAGENKSAIEAVSDKMLGILSIVKGPPQKTAEILKEAVKRLQNKPQPDILSHDNFNSDHSDNSTQFNEVKNQLSGDVIDCGQYSSNTNVLPKPDLALVNVTSTGTVYNLVNGKCIGVKENISTCKGNRPNNIQIIPTAIIPRSVRKSPLTEIVEADNIKPISDICNKQETNIESPKPQQKQSVPTLKALQLKTLNLISAGKLLKPNKTIATKILNKAIHQNYSQLKRKTHSLQNPIIKKPKTTINSRLITKVDIPTVKRLIINVGGKSETESDDDRSISMINSKDQIDDPLYDMASPMSLPMESPCDSPLPILLGRLSPANAVAANDVNVNTDTIVPSQSSYVPTPKILNESFQSKLDEFLKNARSKVDLIKKESGGTTIKTTPTSRLTNNTPLAVRHLPPSSQLEYRRLVNRMQILEKQKQARNKLVVATKEKSLKVTINNDISVVKPSPPTNAKEESSTITYTPTIIKPLIAADIGVKPGPKELAKPNYVPEVISKSVATIKPTQNSTAKPERIVGKTIPTKTEKAKRTLVEIRKQLKESDKEKKKMTVPAIAKKGKPRSLSECKEDYKETSSSLLENMTKTINLVVAAKDEKREKLMLQNELHELRERMLDVERKIKLKNIKMAKIYPEISSSHKTIIDLKAQTLQLEKHSVHFCKNSKMDTNKLYADERIKIMELSKKLSAEIKNLKNLKYSDFKSRMIEKGISAIPEILNQSVQVDLISTSINDDEGKSIKCNNDESMVSKCDSENVQSRLEVVSMDCKQRLEDKLEETVNLDCIDGGKIKENRAESDEIDNNMENIEGTEFQNISNVRKYISPLDFTNDKGPINPYGIICPYQLMGQCDDKECKFEHLYSTT